jgi:hypothetical protein
MERNSQRVQPNSPAPKSKKADYSDDNLSLAKASMLSAKQPVVCFVTVLGSPQPNKVQHT